MRRFLIWMVQLVTALTLAYQWSQGSVAAMNVAIFVLWASIAMVFVFASLLMIAVVAGKPIVYPKNPIMDLLNLAFDICLITALASIGYFATAGAWLIACFLAYAAMVISNDEHRKQGAK
jgi:hypothetical protein